MSITDTTSTLKRFEIVSSYGTFEISKIVEAEDARDASSHAGIMLDLEAAGWTFSESPDGESHEIFELHADGSRTEATDWDDEDE